ncbi:MAG: alpha-L-fucosidase [Bacteroidota bacterium]|nr:alpha-L-fucosidase [Bacteroidota bacterium]
MKQFNVILIAFFFLLNGPLIKAQEKHPDIQWFKDAKFGLFIHWGLYAELGGVYKGKNYYGSGEWIMNQAKIPAAEYAGLAKDFNPVNFNAEEWAQIARDAGIRYMVITAKHHEGFSMFDTKISDFNIVKASPYGKDPMKALSVAARKRGIKFGFYYSQFLDWHEPNGGGNDWDFDESKKNYQQYYRDKSIPQLKELLTNYGPLGIIWFDMPGGLSREQTKSMVDSLHVLQPNALFSSRVGQGLGDYTDYGDSDVPPLPVPGAWESIYTHNDTWGYIAHDMNFKSPEEIIHLLANVASKGGNLMLNIGPDGKGNIPPYSVRYLRATGKWLQKFGESIYGSTYGLIPAQPWGVTTSKPGKLFLHVMNRPEDGKLLVPGMNVSIHKIMQLDNKRPVTWKLKGTDLYVDLPELSDKRNTVFVVAYNGRLKSFDLTLPLVVSSKYKLNTVDAVFAQRKGAAQIESLTYSHYFGDWKHATCVTHLNQVEDEADFKVRVTEPGDYNIILEYACPEASSKQEGILEFDGQDYKFRTLRTSAYDENEPLLFIKHPVSMVTVSHPGIYTVKIHPLHNGNELFYLKAVLFEPAD